MLNSAVLVLNRHYQPVHVTNVKRAVSLLYQGVARALDERYRLYDFADWASLSEAVGEETLRTTARGIRVPRVLVLSVFEKLPRMRVRFSRLNIYARDGDTCQYCGRRRRRSELNLDHVVPRSQGGATCWENVVCSCIGCNLKKGGRTPAQANMALLRAPFRPKWTPLLRGSPLSAHRTWLPFLNLADAAYWNVELSDG